MFSEASEAQPLFDRFSFPEEGDINWKNKALREIIFEVYGGKCNYTGRAIADDEFSIDHIIPRSKGGPDNVFNYAPTTISLNGRKSDSLDIESAGFFLDGVRERSEKIVRLYIERMGGRQSTPDKPVARSDVRIDIITEGHTHCADWQISVDGRIYTLSYYSNHKKAARAMSRLNESFGAEEKTGYPQDATAFVKAVHSAFIKSVDPSLGSKDFSSYFYFYDEKGNYLHASSARSETKRKAPRRKGGECIEFNVVVSTN